MSAAEEQTLQQLLAAEVLEGHELDRLHEIVRDADVGRDVDLAFQVRMKLFQFSNWDIATEFVSFAWCLSHFQREPQRFAFAADKLLSEFNWIANYLYAFPQITLDQLWGLLAQMKDCSLRFGHTLRPVYEKTWRTALMVGDVRRLRRNYALWERAPDDDLTPCEACESDARVEYWAYFNEHKHALTAGAGVLSGREACNNRPHTLSRLLRPLALLGRHDEAEACRRQSYRLISRDTDWNYLFHLAEHLAYLRHAHDFSKGLTLLEKYLPEALEDDDLDNQFRFYTASAAFLSRLAEHRRTVSLRVPRSFPPRVSSDRYDPALLARWFEQQAQPLGVRFDQRNRNLRYTNKVREQLYY